jgi:4-nitrophenyl phosphatase
VADWPPPPGTWVLDLDGVVWLNGEPIPGAADAVARLRGMGARTVFCTNNSSLTVDQLLTRLSAVGVDANEDDVVSSAQAAAGMLEPGSTALPLAGEGVIEALAARGVQIVEAGPADAVVVGWTRQFDFDGLERASAAVRGGARLIGTNEDATYPTPEGLLPGGGSLLAAVATASERSAEVAGKPHRPLVDLLARRAPDVVAVVGDRPSTDGRLAARLGVPYALVLSGVTGPTAVTDDSGAAVVAADLGVLVSELVP